MKTVSMVTSFLLMKRRAKLGFSNLDILQQVHICSTLTMHGGGLTALYVSGCRRDVTVRMSRIGGPQERPHDRAQLADVLAFTIMYTRLCTDEAPFDKKTVRLVLDLHQRVTHCDLVIYLPVLRLTELTCLAT